MARRVFFSFHYERDSVRAGVVRNHDLTKKNFSDAGYIDAAAWEEVKRSGDEAIKRWINQQLQGTTVTVVLIGAETASREWVKYEIRKSRENGNGIFGIRIHNIPDFQKKTDIPGKDPFEELGWKGVQVYDWVLNEGYKNFSTWVENAANQKWNVS